MDEFKALADVREVDTRDDKGTKGYRGTEYRLGKLVYMSLLVYNRFTEPYPEERFVFGSRRVTKKDFLERFENQVESGKIKI